MTITVGAVTLAGGNSGKVEDEQEFALSLRDGDSVENVIGSAAPAIFRRGNRLASCSFTVAYEYATPAAAIAALIGWNDNFTGTETVVFAEGGTLMTLNPALITLANGTRQGCTVRINWQITGKVA